MLFFPRAGYIDSSSSVASAISSYVGFYGYAWSSTILDRDGAYGLIFYTTAVFPSGNIYHRHYANPVRCLVN